MKNRAAYMTAQELNAVKDRCTEALQVVKEKGDIAEGLIAYAVENGYDEAEARSLVRNQVIPTVDQYNAMCRRKVDAQNHEWVLEAVQESASEMSLSEECKFKLGIITALKGVNLNFLSQVGGQSEAERELSYLEMSENSLADLEDASYTEESLAEINGELDAALESASLDAQIAGQINRLIENHADQEEVHGFLTELWRDEEYKYCAALAGCVARKNRELPSIPEEADDTVVVVGVCQGIDTANVVARVSKGEMAVDKAYAILRTIALVGLCILVTAVITTLAIVGALVTIGWVAEQLGTALAACLLAVALGGVVLFTIMISLPQVLETVAEAFRGVVDCTYGMLKTGVKKVAEFAKARVLPKLAELWDRFSAFVGRLKGSLLNRMNRRVRVTT